MRRLDQALERCCAGTHVHVAIDPEEPIGTEEPFIRLNGGEPRAPSQLSSLGSAPKAGSATFMKRTASST